MNECNMGFFHENEIAYLLFLNIKKNIGVKYTFAKIIVLSLPPLH